MNRDVAKKFNALLSLLQDENPKIASLAMEQLLKLGPLTEEAIAEHQDSHDPQLRLRMHQLTAILGRRRTRTQFIERIQREDISLWDGVCQINTIVDPRCNRRQITADVKVLSDAIAKSGNTAFAGIAALMREHEYSVPEADVLDVDLYLAERVLQNHEGSAPLFCALIHRLTEQAGRATTVALYEGRFCVVDEANVLLDPATGWRVTKMKASDKIHPCGRKDVWLGILSQMFLISLVEGDLREVYQLADLLTAFNNSHVDTLPYPLGTLQSD